MTEASYLCSRGIYLLDLPLEYIESSLAAYQPPYGKKKKIKLGLSEVEAGWRLLGVGDPLPLSSLLDLACTLFGGTDEEEFDFEKLEKDILIAAENLIVFQYLPGQPTLSYYLTIEETDNLDIAFVGRREDGKGMRVDVVEDTVRLNRDDTPIIQVIDYLKGRGVPSSLLPADAGCAFTPVRTYPLAVRVE